MVHQRLAGAAAAAARVRRVAAAAPRLPPVPVPRRPPRPSAAPFHTAPRHAAPSLWDNVAGGPGVRASVAYATEFATQYGAAEAVGAAGTLGLPSNAHAHAIRVPDRKVRAEPAATDGAAAAAQLLAAARAAAAAPPADRATHFAHLQTALAAAYVPVLRPFAAGRPGDAPAALTLLGTVAEALIALDMPAASVLARKLLVFAQTHVGPLAQAHYERMAATAGRNGHYSLVLQLVRIAAQGGALGMPLQYARVLALSMLHCDADVFAAAQDMPRAAPAYMHELLVEHFLRLHDMPNALRCLHTLCAEHGMSTYMWRILLSTRQNVCAALRDASGAAPEDLVASLVRTLARRNALADVQWVLALTRIPDPGGCPPPHSALIAALHTHMGAEHVRTTCTIIALVTTLYGRLAHADAALAGYATALTYAPRAHTRGPGWAVYERRTGRDADVEALQHALIGAAQGLLRAARPAHAYHLLTRAVSGASAAAAAPPADAAHIDALPTDAVEPGSLCTAALLETAAALRSAPAAAAALRDAVRDRIVLGGRIFRALARLVLATVHGSPAALHAIFAALEHVPTWHGGRAPVCPAAARLLKLRRALEALGFDERVRRACAAAERGAAAAGRHVRIAVPRLCTGEWDAAAAGGGSAAAGGPALAPSLHISTLCAHGDLQAAQHALVSLQERGMTPRAAHVEPLVDALCRAGRAADAFTLRRLAQAEWHVAPTLRMHEALLSAYAASEDWPMVAFLEREAHARAAMPPQAAAAATRVASCASVAAHYKYLMKQRPAAAQEYYAACLARGLQPDYALRRAVKRAEHWLRRQRLSSSTAVRAHALAAENYARSRGDSAAARRGVHADVEFRRGVLALVESVLSGSLEREVRGPIP